MEKKNFSFTGFQNFFISFQAECARILAKIVDGGDFYQEVTICHLYNVERTPIPIRMVIKSENQQEFDTFFHTRLTLFHLQFSTNIKSER